MQKRKSPHSPRGLANSALILVTSGITPRRACEIVCRRFEVEPPKLFIEQTRNELEKLLEILEDSSDNFELKNALKKAERQTEKLKNPWWQRD